MLLFYTFILSFPVCPGQTAGRRNAVLDLLGFWIEEADEDALKREGEALRFGL